MLFRIIAVLQICRSLREHCNCSHSFSALFAVWQQCPLLRLRICIATYSYRSSNAVLLGGQVVEPDEPERKQGNMLVKHSDVIQYVFLNGVACIIAERYKESKPLSPNAYLVFDEHGNFAKRI